MKKFKITLLVCCLLGLSYQNFALADDQTQTVVTSQKVADSSNPYTLIATLADNTFSSIKANKDKLSDAILKGLVEHFSQHNLSNSEVKSAVSIFVYTVVFKKIDTAF